MLSGSARKTIREFVNRVVQVFGCDGAAFYYRPTGEILPLRARRASRSPTTNCRRRPKSKTSRSTPARALATAPVRLGGGRWAAWRWSAPLPSEQIVRAIVNLVAHHHRKGARAGGRQPRRSRAPERGAEIGAARFAGARYQDAADFHQSRGHQPAGQARRRTERELLTIINEEADRLNQLAAEVIAMARIEAGKLHLEKRPVAAAT